MKAFRKILIANRGEIAVRVHEAAWPLGYRTVAVYSDADRDALHVQTCTEAVRIGPPPVAESYLNIPAILEAAKQTGADAVHPGYGFLSENAAFAEACERAGLVFIGPPPAAIAAMGNKAAAKRRMIEAGVPCVPGYQGTDQSDGNLETEAHKIGLPVMVKAADTFTTFAFSLAFGKVPLVMLLALAAKVVALVYAVAALPVIHEATLATVAEELPRYVAALAVRVATFADKPAVV